MNKKLVIGIIIGVVVIVGATAAVIVMNMNAANQTTISKTAATGKPVRACALLSLTEAKSILGETAKLGDNPNAVTNESVSVDTCSYVNGASEVADIRVITVMVRTGLDDAGKASNEDAFQPNGEARAEDAEAVGGYGEQAYWSETMKQLSILDGAVWINIVYGGESTLSATKLVADSVVN